MAKEVALSEGREASNWLTGDVGEEMGSAVQHLAESSRGRGGMHILIPEEGEFDDDTDLQRYRYRCGVVTGLTDINWHELGALF